MSWKRCKASPHRTADFVTFLVAFLVFCSDLGVLVLGESPPKSSVPACFPPPNNRAPEKGFTRLEGKVYLTMWSVDSDVVVHATWPQLVSCVSEHLKKPKVGLLEEADFMLEFVKQFKIPEDVIKQLEAKRVCLVLHTTVTLFSDISALNRRNCSARWFFDLRISESATGG